MVNELARLSASAAQVHHIGYCSVTKTSIFHWTQYIALLVGKVRKGLNIFVTLGMIHRKMEKLRNDYSINAKCFRFSRLLYLITGYIGAFLCVEMSIINHKINMNVS